MCKLGRITFRFTWNGLNAKLINFSGRSRREYYLIFQFCKESIPERIVLKHIQYTGNTYFATDCFLRRKRLIGEKPFVLVFIKVWDMVLVLFFTNTALTAVTAYKLTSAGEFVDGKTTVVGTSVTVGHRCCVFQLIDLFNGEHGSFTVLRMITLFCDQGSTESAHDSCNVRADGLTACNTFKTS